MISLAPLKEKDKINLFFSKANLDANENSGCVAATQNGEVLGFCLYDLSQMRNFSPSSALLRTSPKNLLKSKSFLKAVVVVKID